MATHLLYGHLDNGILHTVLLLVQAPWHQEQKLVWAHVVQSWTVEQLDVAVASELHIRPWFEILEATK